MVDRFLAASGVEHCWQITVAHVADYLNNLRAGVTIPAGQSVTFNGQAFTAPAVRALVVLGRSDRTVQAHRNTLRMFCAFLLRSGQLDVNPVDALTVASPAKAPPRYLNDRQLWLSLLHVRRRAPRWVYDAFCLALYAGPRLSSLRALRWEHVHAEGLVVPLTKTGQYAVVPFDEPAIGPQLRKVMGRMKRGRPGDPIFPVHHPRWWGEQLARATEGLEVFGEAGRRAGARWHLCRSTWAVNAARRGATLWQLCSWGGWQTPAVVTRYVNLARAAGRLAPRPMKG